MGRILQGKAADKYDAPAGTLACFAGVLESGWLAPNGDLVNIATYPDLFSAIGTTFGGDGVTSFALPSVSALEMCGNAAFTVGIKAFGYAKNTPVMDLDSLAGLKNVPVGAEMMWQKETLPDVNSYGVWLEQDGATFDEAVYPELYAHLGTNVLPDMRGEFARGWDHGRGIDSGRGFGSSQLDSFQGHWHLLSYQGLNESGVSVSLSDAADGTSTPPRNLQTNLSATDISADETHGTPRIASETRPRNIAKLFLIKAK